MKQPFLFIPIKGIAKLAELNGIQNATEKALEEIEELSVELRKNSSDEDLLNEVADTIITSLQVLKQKGIINKLPMTIVKKTTKGLNSFGVTVKEDLNINKYREEANNA